MKLMHKTIIRILKKNYILKDERRLINNSYIIIRINSTK
jgi:hypothetical protein